MAPPGAKPGGSWQGASKGDTGEDMGIEVFVGMFKRRLTFKGVAQLQALPICQQVHPAQGEGNSPDRNGKGKASFRLFEKH